MRHIELKHGDVEALQGSLNAQEKSHKYVCAVCTARFRFRSNYFTHLRTQHPDATEVLLETKRSCRDCGESFDDAHQLSKHLLKCVKAKAASGSHHQCQICGKSCHSRNKLLRHVSLHATHTCEECDRDFSRASQLRSHMVRCHSNERPYKCEYCFKGFVTQSELRSHLVTHTGVSSHQCSTCSRVFSTAAGLRRHVQRMHELVDRFVCTQCGQGFRVKRDLDNHVLRHTDPTPFRCRYCRKGFAWSQGLKRHEKMHEKRAEEEQESRTMTVDGEQTPCNPVTIVGVNGAASTPAVANEALYAEDGLVYLQSTQEDMRESYVVRQTVKSVAQQPFVLPQSAFEAPFQDVQNFVQVDDDVSQQNNVVMLEDQIAEQNVFPSFLEPDTGASARAQMMTYNLEFADDNSGGSVLLQRLKEGVVDRRSQNLQSQLQSHLQSHLQPSQLAQEFVYVNPNHQFISQK